MRPWIDLIFAVSVSGCLTVGTTTPIVEVPLEEAYVEATATPLCQHSLAVTVETRRISDSTVELHASGLQPGEMPYVIYSTFSKNGGTMGEMGIFLEGADENGEFSVSLPGLIPLGGEISATWDIRFIHARGVECTTITLP
jgi:hypothetical protein